MRIEYLCRRPVVSIAETARVGEAAALMRSQHVGALVVTASDVDGPHVVGMVTDRDLVVEGLARGRAGTDDRVGPLASRKLVTVGEGATFDEAIAAMREAGVRRVLVVNAADRRLLGVVSSDDLHEALAAELSQLGQVLRFGLKRETELHPAAEPEPERPVFLRAGTPGMPWPA